MAKLHCSRSFFEVHFFPFYSQLLPWKFLELINKSIPFSQIWYVCTHIGNIGTHFFALLVKFPDEISLEKSHSHAHTHVASTHYLQTRSYYYTPPPSLLKFTIVQFIGMHTIWSTLYQTDYENSNLIYENPIDSLLISLRSSGRSSRSTNLLLLMWIF